MKPSLHFCTSNNKGSLGISEFLLNECKWKNIAFPSSALVQVCDYNLYLEVVAVKILGLHSKGNKRFLGLFRRWVS